MRYALLTLPLFLLAPAFAQDEAKPERAKSFLQERDRDGDGRLSPEEFGADRAVFDLLDRDGDGFVTAAELPRRKEPKAGRPEGAPPAAQARQRAEHMLQQHDKDGDGRLAAEEWPISRVPSTEADANGDGFVDLEELTAFVGGRFGPGPGRDPGAGPGPGRGPGGPPADRPGLREMAAGLMQRLDTDGDGRLTGDEIPREGRLDLSEADRNGDGAVDLFEVTLVLGERAGRAGGGPGGGAGMLVRRLKQADANKDGVLDREEWPGPADRFDALDADKDGRLTEAELKAALEGRGGGPDRWMDRTADAAFRRFDADEDGRITAEEWKARPELFRRFDANGDGAITRDELTPKGPAGGRRARALDLRSGKDSAHFLEKYDGNRDGQVTKEEFPHERRFTEIDADGDGVLTEAEIKDAMDKKRNEEAYDFFDRFDLDSDGKVTREEFSGPAAAFERLDRNHDGVIDEADGVGR